MLAQKLLAVAQVGSSAVLYLLIILSVLSIGVILERWLWFRKDSKAADLLQKRFVTELTKVVNRTGEDGRVAIRNLRRDARELLEAAGKDGDITEDDVEMGLKKIQAVIDKAVGKVDEIIAKKQAEIMEV